MRLNFIIALILTCLSCVAFGTDKQTLAVEAVLNDYIEGTSFSQKNQIKQAFSDNALLLLEKKDNPLWEVPVSEYIGWFKSENAGQSNGRIGEILSVNVEGNIATAKVEILIPGSSLRFVDMFLLKRLEGRWKIISKSAENHSANNNGERILFIVSNAHFHGGSKLPAGVSFSEIVKAYDTFKEAGYTVDFVSPEGGAIPLSYINTSTPIHKKYLYNTDFMYTLANTKSPNDIVPARYKAVHYVGGSNAMYGVAENEALQSIAMDVYEKHGGIISSVCHGTAGIVNLKTSDGKYLVEGKRISGYPEAYEAKDREYFKEFPFLIQKTIEDRGGKFFVAKRNNAHVEVDGRIVTGQNHLSSPLVAKKMIELLQKL